MYEQFFALERRPFSPTPTAEHFVETGTAVAAVDGITSTIVDGAPIVLLTAPGGLGKTIVCQKVAASLPEQFQPVIVTSGNFSSPRMLLQSCLFELGAPYSQIPDDELRLGLLEQLRTIREDGKTAVLLLDEAHLVDHEVFEELRAIADAQQNGCRLATIVLAGQLELEETLADPKLDAVNQRVHRHLMLESLSREESQAYVADRIALAGGDVEVCFDEEALGLIARTADGSPRALNQLCDQTLLLAHVDERQPADVEVVLEAYENVKHLPLHWNAPLAEDHDASAFTTDDDGLLDDSIEPAFEPEPVSVSEPSSVVEIVEPLTEPVDSVEEEAMGDESEAVVFEVGWSDESGESPAAVDVEQTPVGDAEPRDMVDEIEKVDDAPPLVFEPIRPEPVSSELDLATPSWSPGPTSPLGKFDESVEWDEEPLPAESRRLRGLPVDPLAEEPIAAEEPEVDVSETPTAELEPPVIDEMVILPEADEESLSDIVLPEPEQFLTGPAATFEIGGEPEVPAEPSPAVEDVVREPAAFTEPEPEAAPSAEVEVAVERQIERELDQITRETSRLLRADAESASRRARYDVVEPETSSQSTAIEAPVPSEATRSRGRRPRRYARLFSELRREHHESRR